MNQQRNRKYPRVYERKVAENMEKALTLSMATAAGIVTSIFAGGIVLGYMIRRSLN